MSTDGGQNLAVLVGATIAVRRKQMGLTQAQLAEFLDITQDSLSRMEKGVIAPKFSRLQRLADGLDCSVADLFRQTETSAQALAESVAQKISPLHPELRLLVMELVENAVRTLTKIPWPERQ